MKKRQKFWLNFAALAICPANVVNAKTADDQINMIYDLADNPTTPQDRATALAALAGRMVSKLDKQPFA